MHAPDLVYLSILASMAYKRILEEPAEDSSPISIDLNPSLHKEIDPK
jgi:hypothetical protein